MERPSIHHVRVDPPGPAPRAPLDWSRLAAIASPETALRTIVEALGPAEATDWTLELCEGETLAEDVATPWVDVPGDPRWRVTGPAGGVAAVAQALAAWRAARVGLDEAERRLRERTEELDLLHALGREATEARTLETLFRAAARVLHARRELDLVAFARVLLEGTVVASVYPARPFEAEELRSVVRGALLRLQASPERAPRLVVELTEDYDEAKGRRHGSAAEAALHLALARRGGAPACMSVVPDRPLTERDRRLLFGVANQLALNVDRILSVQEAERGRFRATLDSMPQAVFLTDRSLRVLETNQAAEQRRRALDLPDVGGTLGQVGSLRMAPLAQAVLADGGRLVEGEGRTEEGRIYGVTVSALGADLHDEEALVVVLSDVTERDRLQRQLAQSEKLSSLGQMISGVAHELNNPLASILGFAQLARAAAGDEKMGKRLEVLEKQARRCQRIVQNLLSFARGHEPERQALSLNEVVDSVIALMAYQLRVDDVEVVAELDRSLPALVGDRHQLQQVLVNLLTNARQAIRGAGRPGTVRIRTGPGAEGRIRLEVEDDGPGVPSELRSRIFDPFFTTKAAGKGTGLGLSLVYGIVESHGGTLVLRPGTQGGACFVVELPRGVRAVRPATPETPEPAPDPTRSGSILVVDDEAEVATVICEALGAEGHRVEAVANGREALVRMEQREFDLVISDLKMPVMGGKRLYEEIRRRRPRMSSRLLLTTGDTVSGEPESLAGNAGLGLIHKPFDLEQLRRAVRERLARGDG